MTLFLKIIKFLKFLFFSGLAAVSIAGLGTMFLVFYMTKDLPQLPSPLSRIIERPQTQIFSSSGQVISTMGQRKTIPLNMVSRDFINAIISIEDHRFFEHHGINKLRTLKALYLNIFTSGRIQGASTITQQLAKNLFFSFEKTYSRKFKELLVSLQIESSNTKEEILHAYVNQIYFGAGAQGVEKASQRFFNKPALQLELHEAALLAGLPKSPANYNPYRHLDRAIGRRNIVLRRMKQVGFISDLEYQQAMHKIPEIDPGTENKDVGSYFLDTLVGRLIEKYGEDVVYHGGIKVFSTLDTRLQAHARHALLNGLKNVDTLMGLQGENDTYPQGALVSVDAGSGAVKALVGGREYAKSQFNRAMNSSRQAGSGFKPFLYYTAFKHLGFHPGTVMTDQPVTISIQGSKEWRPENFGNAFSGDMVLKKALFKSVNTIAAQLIEKTGPKAVNRTARMCGIVSPLKDVFSTALGTSGVTPFEMASAYTVFANQGILHSPFFFWRIEDAFGRIIFEHIVTEKRVLEPAIAYQVVNMMKSVIERGSGRSIKRAGFDYPAAGKTGTTDHFKDAWFTGFTPSLCTSVWMGFDREKTMVDADGRGITGGRAAAPIWAEFMKNALKSEPERDFPIPDTIRFESADATTGCPPFEEETFDLTDMNFNPLRRLLSREKPAVEMLDIPLKSDQRLCEGKNGNQP